MSKSKSELHARFESTLAHYAGFHKRFADCPSDEWAIPAYAWKSAGSGISLSPIEDFVWEEIRLANVIMYPQFPVGRFFVDFGNPAAKVAIECDGAAFHKDKEKDAMRQHAIESLGWSVYRITGAAIWVNPPDEFDDDGNLLNSMSPGQDLIQMMCLRHPIKRHSLGGREKSGAVRLSTLAEKMIAEVARG